MPAPEERGCILCGNKSDHKFALQSTRWGSHDFLCDGCVCEIARTGKPVFAAGYDIAFEEQTTKDKFGVVIRTVQSVVATHRPYGHKTRIPLSIVGKHAVINQLEAHYKTAANELIEAFDEVEELMKKS